MTSSALHIATAIFFAGALPALRNKFDPTRQLSVSLTVIGHQDRKGKQHLEIAEIFKANSHYVNYFTSKWVI